MKQASKKVSNVKVPATKTAHAPKNTGAAKVDLSLLQKADQFHRYLEASCDCV